MDKLIKKWEYHLPSDVDQLKQFAREVMLKVIELKMGENINGTLLARIDPELILEEMRKMK